MHIWALHLCKEVKKYNGEKQKYRPTEQERKSRDRPMHIWALHLCKEVKIYNGEKIASSVTGDGKTEHYV